MIASQDPVCVEHAAALRHCARLTDVLFLLWLLSLAWRWVVRECRAFLARGPARA